MVACGEPGARSNGPRCMRINTDSIVGRIPCGTIVPYDNAIVFHSPSAPNLGVIDPVVRYRCLATATTPAGWISDRGRFPQHPYQICERIRAALPPQPHMPSHVSVGRVWPPNHGLCRQEKVPFWVVHGLCYAASTSSGSSRAWTSYAPRQSNIGTRVASTSGQYFTYVHAVWRASAA